MMEIPTARRDDGFVSFQYNNQMRIFNRWWWWSCTLHSTHTRTGTWVSRKNVWVNTHTGAETESALACVLVCLVKILGFSHFVCGGLLFSCHFPRPTRQFALSTHYKAPSPTICIWGVFTHDGRRTNLSRSLVSSWPHRPASQNRKDFSMNTTRGAKTTNRNRNLSVSVCLLRRQPFTIIKNRPTNKTSEPHKSNFRQHTNDDRQICV